MNCSGCDAYGEYSTWERVWCGSVRVTHKTCKLGCSQTGIGECIEFGTGDIIAAKIKEYRRIGIEGCIEELESWPVEEHDFMYRKMLRDYRNDLANLLAPPQVCT